MKGLVNSVAYADGLRIGEVAIPDISEVLKQSGRFVWVGLHEPDDEMLAEIQQEFSLHDLAVEDAARAHQRPKLERYGNSVFVVLRTAHIDRSTGGIDYGETHIFLGSGVPAVHLVHEVAHQWFYGLAGNDQYRDPWLDEGLATYAESRVDGGLAYQRGRALPAYGRGHLGESMAYWSRVDGGTYYLSVYVGGVQALGAVADRLGGYAPLDCALRRYVHDRAYTVSRPSDLMAAFAAQTGVDPRPIVAPFGVH